MTYWSHPNELSKPKNLKIKIKKKWRTITLRIKHGFVD